MRFEPLHNRAEFDSYIMRCATFNSAVTIVKDIYVDNVDNKDDDNSSFTPTMDSFKTTIARFA